MSKKRNQKIQNKEYNDSVSYSQQIKEQQSESASLKELNDNHVLRNNHPNVKAAIQTDPELSKLSGRELSNIKKRERQKEQRLVRKAAKRAKYSVSEQDVSMADENSDVDRQSDPEYQPCQDQPERLGKGGQSPVNVHVRLTNKKRQAELMLKKTCELAVDSPFRQAMIKWLQNYAKEQPQIYQDLKRLLIEEQAATLAQRFLNQESILLSRILDESISKRVVIEAFIVASSKNDRIKKDQRLLMQLLIPVLKRIKRFPNAIGAQAEGMKLVLEACLRFYSNEKDPDPPLELYLYAHSIGRVSECIRAFKSSRRSEKLMKQVLAIQSLQSSVAQVIVDYPDKLGYSKLIDYCAELQPDHAKQLCRILQKCDIDSDPSDGAKGLADRLRRNFHIAVELEQYVDSIPLKPEELDSFLQEAENLDVTLVRSIINESSDRNWLESINKLKLDEEAGRPSELKDKDIWQQESVRLGIEVAYEKVCELSKDFEMQSEHYSHNAFQCYAVTRIQVPVGRVKVLVAPTGSGKTFIGALLAFIEDLRGKRVAYVTPNRWLAQQVQEQIGQYRHCLRVLPLDDALLQLSQFDTIIADEGDQLLTKSHPVIDQANKRIHGFWDLLEKDIYILTATAAYDMQTLLQELYRVQPSSYIDLEPNLKRLKCHSGSINFKSITVEDHGCFKEHLEEKIVDWFRDYPIIVFYDSIKVQQATEEIIKSYGIPKYVVRSYEETKSAKIIAKRVNRGIAMVKREFGRGLDLKFQEDAKVIVTFEPDDFDEAVQLAGRSSRTMKVHSCLLLLENKSIQSADLKEYLKAKGKGVIKDGVRLIKALLGSRLERGYSDDSELMKTVIQTWRLDLKTIQRKLGKQRHLELENLYDYGSIEVTPTRALRKKQQE